MRKILSILFVISITSSLAVFAAESRLENYVNKKMAPITQQEKEFYEKIEAQEDARAARREEYIKRHEARRASLQKQHEEYQKQQEKKYTEYKKRQEARRAQYQKQHNLAKQRRENTKKAIEAEKDFWESVIDD